MNELLYDNIKDTKLIKDYLKENPQLGILRIQVQTASSALPIANADIKIYKEFDNNKVVFYQDKTNSNGIIDNILLPTPSNNTSNMTIPNYSIYYLDVIKKGYMPINGYMIGLYQDTKSIQNIILIPKVNIEKK